VFETQQNRFQQQKSKSWWIIEKIEATKSYFIVTVKKNQFGMTARRIQTYAMGKCLRLQLQHKLSGWK